MGGPGGEAPRKIFLEFCTKYSNIGVFFRDEQLKKTDEQKWMRRKKRMSKNRCAQKLEMSKTGMSAFFTADEHDFRQMCNSNYCELVRFVAYSFFSGKKS